MATDGRFDEIFFVDLPTQNERLEILKLHLGRRLQHPEVVGSFAIDDLTLGKLAHATEGFVGAELEQVVISGIFEAFYEERSVQLADFERAISLTVPLSVTQAEQIHHLREWANVRAVAATHREDRSAYLAPAQSVKSDDATAQLDQNDILGSRGGRPIDF